MAVIRIATGKSSSATCTLNASWATLIGRADDCEIVLSGDSVSRRHARISADESGFWLEDLGSKNGTFVNGLRIVERTRLTPGDRLLIGSIELEFADTEACDSDEDLSTVVQAGEVEDGYCFEAPANSQADTKPPESADTAEIEIQSGELLRSLLSITSELGALTNPEDALPLALDRLMLIFPNCDAGAIFTSEPDTRPAPAAVRKRSNGGIETAVIGDAPEAVFNRVRTTRLFESDEALGQSLFQLPAASVLRVPLVGRDGEAYGFIQLETCDPDTPFGVACLEVVSAVAVMCVQALRRSAADRIQLELQRREQQLRTAREIQLRMVPEAPPRVEGYAIQHYYEAADLVGGDYLSYVTLPDGRFGMALADVAGKGLTAALTMAQFTAEVRHCVENSSSVGEVMRRLNDFCSRIADTMVTCLFCVLDPRAHTLSIANAGHWPPLIRRGAGSDVESLGPGQSSLPLGVDEHDHYRVVTHSLEPDDMLLMYTDGLCDTVNPDGDLFGLTRVREVLQQAPLQPRKVVSRMQSQLAKFRGTAPRADDTCIICLARLPAPSG